MGETLAAYALLRLRLLLAAWFEDPFGPAFETSATIGCETADRPLTAPAIEAQLRPRSSHESSRRSKSLHNHKLQWREAIVNDRTVIRSTSMPIASSAMLPTR